MVPDAPEFIGFVHFKVLINVVTALLNVKRCNCFLLPLLLNYSSAAWILRVVAES